ncbi:hypothetical protein MHYP_G00025720 [Metynnis hypsauchen]
MSPTNWHYNVWWNGQRAWSSVTDRRGSRHRKSMRNNESTGKPRGFVEKPVLSRGIELCSSWTRNRT